MVHQSPGLCRLASVALCVAVPLAAGDAPQNLSLRQALAQALAQNPQVQLSILSVAQSEQDRQIAASALLPTVEAQALGQRSKSNLDTFLGQATPGGPAVIGPYTWGQVGVEAHVPLLDLSLWSRWKAARHAAEGAQARARAVREEIAGLVVGQYLRGLRSAASVKAIQARVTLAQALADLAENQQKQGVGTKLDSLRSQVQLQTERQRLIQAETQFKTALFGLSKLLGLEPGASLNLTDELSAPPIPEFTFQEAFEAGLRERPESIGLQARERAAQNLQAAAQQLHLPALVASGSYASTGLYQQPWIPTYQVSLALKVPLFTGGRTSALAAKAKADLGKVAEERRDLKTQVGLEIQVAQAELTSAGNEVQVAAQTVQLAGEALTQAQHRFEAGVSSNIEVINAQDEFARAQDGHISALYRLNQARADLARAMGRLETLYSK